MLKSGLVSISFRKLSVAEIVEMCAKAGLKGIEWGGDVHVPHGDWKAAEAAKRMTADAGLKVAAYGSYYRAGVSEQAGLSFSEVLDSAVELEAPTIRVWAGNKAFAEIEPEEYCAIVEDLLRIGQMAGEQGITVSLECHGNTLTDTNDSAIKLKQDLAGSPVCFYWQPPVGTSFEYRLDGLRQMLPVMTNQHVYHWQPGTKRCPLAEGTAEWAEYLKLAASVKGTHYALLEFFRDDSGEQFYEDAATLKKLIASLNKPE
ncbi:MAG: TIM barrel protein [Victivallaceae bacterium]